jgi:hypothetical protein
VANVGIVVACVVLVLQALGLHPLGWLGSRPQTPEPLGLARVGEVLSVPGVIWAEADRTMVLAVANGCEICVASLPLYALLAQTAAESGVRVIAVSPESVDETQRFLGSGAVQVTAVSSLQQVSPPIVRLPTVLLVDDLGVVRGTWPGALSQPQVDQILQAVQGQPQAASKGSAQG